MLKLTLAQLQTAVNASESIHALEAAKDAAADATLTLATAAPPTKANPLGLAVQVPVPASMVREAIDQRLRAEHQRLADLGIELTLEVAA